MKHTAHSLATVLVASFAAALAPSANATTGKPAQTSESHMARLSSKGSQAFTDIALARAAIFNGQTTEARKLIKAAQGDLKIAAKDDTAVTRTESQLTPPPGAPVSRSKPTVTSTPIDWLPVGADITVADDFGTKPEQANALASANEKLGKGQRVNAMQTLKLANVKVAYTMALVPLKQTTASVDEAAHLIADDKYYQADQKLKSVQDSERYDWLQLTATPVSGASTPAAASSSSHS
jgi:hypothetical protein